MSKLFQLVENVLSPGQSLEIIECLEASTGDALLDGLVHGGDFLPIVL